MSHHPLSGIQIPVPRLHTALGDPIFPQQGLDCPPFSSAPSQRPPSHGEVRLHNLPLSPAEARACIADLQAMAPEEIARSFQLTLAEHLRAPFGSNEQTALTGFLRDHSPDNASSDAEAIRQLRQAQCQLLMVWVQEERLLEILQLIRRSTHSEARLSRLLSDADLMESDTDHIDNNIDAVRDLLPPWRFVFARLLPFLPPEALLLINDPDMAKAVRTVGTRCEGTDSIPQGGQIFRVDVAQLFSDATGSVRCFVPENNL